MRIEDYAFLSDTETAALVGRNGSIDWLCLPRFDSAACFAKLLGTNENGFWRIAPRAEILRTNRRYRDGTLILETDFECEGGAVRVVDAMPIRDQRPDIVRTVEGLRGTVSMRMQLVLRFEYGRIVPWVRKEDGGIIATSGPHAVILRSDIETHGKDHTTVADFDIREGESRRFVLTWFPSHETPPPAGDVEARMRRTEKFWHDWSEKAACTGPWARAAVRSLITLKGLTFAPTGAVIAAPTNSLPEKIGGARNWDYRFCWLRDATFTLYALLDAGYTEEAAAWRRWLLRAIAGDPAQLQIVFGPGGERDLHEIELSHLPGYEGSQPVRVGNAASGQFQLDNFGEVMDALHQARIRGVQPDESSWDLQQAMTEFVREHWQEPDNGIWEARGRRRQFTHSKVMAWVALDRAIRACGRGGLAGDTAKWKAVRRRIHEEVCERGFHRKLNSFAQTLDGNQLDAAALMIPLVGFLPPDDPRVRGTIAAIERDLMCEGFVMRYIESESDPLDELQRGEGAFLPCSFWLADCLHLTGRTDEARELFERLLGIRNDLDLLSEEYDPVNHRLTGNFPQAFSHVALVNTARNLSESQGPAKHRGGKSD